VSNATTDALVRLTSLSDWRALAEAWRRDGARVGLVPTMGALHEGHASLIRAARAQGDRVLVTSFVNPRQFNDAADLAAYPSTPEEDAALCASAGASALVTPSVATMWPHLPAPTPTTVHVAELGDVLEGEGRPGHFDGVASVVAKLFAITGPCRAYFGEKDFQQTVVVRAMVADLGFDVEVVTCSTIRERDGLALSSRNRRLSEAGRVRARSFAVALRSAQGAHSPEAACDIARVTLEGAGIEVAYVALVDPETLRPVGEGAREGRLLLAGYLEGVRLLDNATVTLGGFDALSD
jgi:pantoate--beta-alanine ligase